ncbi:hypothetical protein N7466_005090 [Penicillium verhagenii]|uniref:uncharacterized protein n=1 Tax=Penicillium verhagenii TaxID=1562060 RepID=UPI0025455EB5|nr:uncharacterized protein N7466_005090 [Penicillium verhagenii]KAJ5935543.1 hypothetical protein N7466_005090 [Penicillium verhagenii]
MSTAPTSAPAANPTTASGPTKVEGQVVGTNGATQSSDVDSKPIDWESEIQLVSSLAKLQELERKIHEIRQFVPAGLLEPLGPISSSNKLSTNNPAAESPAVLRNDLGQSANARYASLEQFQSMWRSPEMKPVWAHVEARLKEANGQIIQPTGMWEKDYDVLFAEMTKAEKTREDERLREEEDAERTKALSSEGQWTAVIERFVQRDIPGVRIIKGQNQTSLVVALARAGMVFLVAGVRDFKSSDVSGWQVSSRVAPGRSTTKLEQAVLECLNSRPRKWDLAFLLDMIASYADIKQTPCTKCTQLTNNAAQLPTIRRAQSTHPSTDEKVRIFAFDALHSSCA